MVKYYWYINVDPARIPDYGSIKPFVKRSISQPSSGYPYISESIDGYKHVIKNSNGKQIATMNDNGNIGEINSINELIINELKMLANSMKEKASKDQLSRSSISLMDDYNRYGSPMFISDEMGMDSFRRSKRIKARLDIKKKTVKRKK